MPILGKYFYKTDLEVMKFKKLIFLASLFMSQWVSAAGWTNGNLEIKAIIWRPGFHGFYVETNTFDNPQNCSGGTQTYLYLFDSATEADAETMNRLYTLITTAMLTDKKINAYVDGCQSELPLVTGIQLNN